MFLAVIRVRATASPLNSAYSRRVGVLPIRLRIQAPPHKQRRQPACPIRCFQARHPPRHGPPLRTRLGHTISLVPSNSDPDPSSSTPLSDLVNSPADVSLFLHTSGTISRPKGVPLTQLNLLPSVQNIISVYQRTESESTVIVLPLFHVHGLMAGLLSSLASAAAGRLPLPCLHLLAILDENGVELGSGVNGEVCIRGPNVTTGYKNNPDANKSAFLFGWFHTGDLGYFDSDGYLHLVGRIKELINRGGEKISPIEVDAVLLSHPNIAQAVAFGIPDEKYGEEINCAVIPRVGSDGEEATRFCKKNLAAFKVPKKVFITEDLPRTATGKIQRRIVAEHFLSKISR